MPRVRPATKQQKERSELKKRLKEHLPRMPAREEPRLRQNRCDRERYETSVHFPLPAGTMARNYSEGDAAEHMERRWRCTIRRGQ